MVVSHKQLVLDGPQDSSKSAHTKDVTLCITQSWLQTLPAPQQYLDHLSSHAFLTIPGCKHEQVVR